jgi:hypothetical protein
MEAHRRAEARGSGAERRGGGAAAAAAARGEQQGGRGPRRGRGGRHG